MVKLQNNLVLFDFSVGCYLKWPWDNREITEECPDKVLWYVLMIPEQIDVNCSTQCWAFLGGARNNALRLLGYLCKKTKQKPLWNLNIAFVSTCIPFVFTGNDICGLLALRETSDALATENEWDNLLKWIRHRKEREMEWDIWIHVNMHHAGLWAHDISRKMCKMYHTLHSTQVIKKKKKNTWRGVPHSYKTSIQYTQGCISLV